MLTATERGLGIGIMPVDSEVVRRHAKLGVIEQQTQGLPNDLRVAFGCMREVIESRSPFSRIVLPPGLGLDGYQGFHRLDGLNGHRSSVGVLVSEWEGTVRHAEHEVRYREYVEREHLHVLSGDDGVVAVVRQGMDVFIPGGEPEAVLGNTVTFLNKLYTTHARHHQ